MKCTFSFINVLHFPFPQFSAKERKKRKAGRKVVQNTAKRRQRIELSMVMKQMLLSLVLVGIFTVHLVHGDNAIDETSSDNNNNLLATKYSSEHDFFATVSIMTIIAVNLLPLPNSGFLLLPIHDIQTTGMLFAMTRDRCDRPTTLNSTWVDQTICDQRNTSSLLFSIVKGGYDSVVAPWEVSEEPFGRFLGSLIIMIIVITFHFMVVFIYSQCRGVKFEAGANSLLWPSLTFKVLFCFHVGLCVEALVLLFSLRKGGQGPTLFFGGLGMLMFVVIVGVVTYVVKYQVECTFSKYYFHQRAEIRHQIEISTAHSSQSLSCDPVNPQGESGQKEKEKQKDKLRKFYAKYCPLKTDVDVNATVEAFAAVEVGYVKMWGMLEEKYGPYPELADDEKRKLASSTSSGGLSTLLGDKLFGKKESVEDTGNEEGAVASKEKEGSRVKLSPEEGDMSNSNGLLRVLMPLGFWGPADQVNSYGALLDICKGSHSQWILLLFLKTFLLSICIAPKFLPLQIQFLLIAVVQFSFVLVLVLNRPFRVPFSQMCSIVHTVLSSLYALSGAIVPLQGEAQGILIILIGIINLLHCLLTYTCVMEYLHYQQREWAYRRRYLHPLSIHLPDDIGKTDEGGQEDRRIDQFALQVRQNQSDDSSNSMMKNARKLRFALEKQSQEENNVKMVDAVTQTFKHTMINARPTLASQLEMKRNVQEAISLAPSSFDGSTDAPLLQFPQRDEYDSSPFPIRLSLARKPPIQLHNTLLASQIHHDLEEENQLRNDFKESETKVSSLHEAKGSSTSPEQDQHDVMDKQLSRFLRYHGLGGY